MCSRLFEANVTPEGGWTSKGSINPKSRVYPQNWIFIEFSPLILRFLQAWGWTRTPEMWVFAVLVILLLTNRWIFHPWNFLFTPTFGACILQVWGWKLTLVFWVLNATPGNKYEWKSMEFDWLNIDIDSGGYRIVEKRGCEGSGARLSMLGPRCGPGNTPKSWQVL